MEGEIKLEGLGVPGHPANMTWALDPAPGDSIAGFSHPVLRNYGVQETEICTLSGEDKIHKCAVLIPRCTAPKNIRYRVATVDRAPSEVVAAPGALLRYFSPKNLRINHGCTLGSPWKTEALGLS